MRQEGISTSLDNLVNFPDVTIIVIWVNCVYQQQQKISGEFTKVVSWWTENFNGWIINTINNVSLSVKEKDNRKESPMTAVFMVANCWVESPPPTQKKSKHNLF